MQCNEGKKWKMEINKRDLTVQQLTRHFFCILRGVRAWPQHRCFFCSFFVFSPSVNSFEFKFLRPLLLSLRFGRFLVKRSTNKEHLRLVLRSIVGSFVRLLSHCCWLCFLLHCKCFHSEWIATPGQWSTHNRQKLVSTSKSDDDDDQNQRGKRTKPKSYFFLLDASRLFSLLLLLLFSVRALMVRGVEKWRICVLSYTLNSH